MADVRPFRGLRYDPARTGDLGHVLCPPYDVVNAEDERRYRDAHPANAIHLELSAASAEQSGDRRYREAADALRNWCEDGILIREQAPAFYLHEVTFRQGDGTSVRRELIAAVRLEPWDRGVILPHERTYDRPKADRLRLLQATKTNISPVLSVFRRDPDTQDAIEAVWTWATEREPRAEGEDLGGLGHRFWVLDDEAIAESVQRFFADRPLFIADGHHRYETALRFRDQVGLAPDPGLSTGTGPDFVMMHLVAEDDPGLVILPIHRLLGGLTGLDAAKIEDLLSTDFHLEYYPVWDDAPPEQIDAFVVQVRAQGDIDRAIGIYGPDPEIFAVASLRKRNALPPSVPADRDPSWQGLDVVLADEAIVRPLLAERSLVAEDVVDYTRDPHEAFGLVRGGARQVALILNPTRVDQVAAVALAGERMPEKSTYFYPKAPTGLVFRPVNDG
jgi:uncharacterized protein (DUF1015 family)